MCIRDRPPRGVFWVTLTDLVDHGSREVDRTHNGRTRTIIAPIELHTVVTLFIRIVGEIEREIRDRVEVRVPPTFL